MAAQAEHAEVETTSGVQPAESKPGRREPGRTRETGTAIPHGTGFRSAGVGAPGAGTPAAAATEPKPVRIGPNHEIVAIVPGSEVAESPSVEDFYGKHETSYKEYPENMTNEITEKVTNVLNNDVVSKVELGEGLFELEDYEPLEKDENEVLYGGSPYALTKPKAYSYTAVYYASGVREGIKGAEVILTPDTDRARHIMHSVGYRTPVFLPADLIVSLLQEGAELQMKVKDATDPEKYVYKKVVLDLSVADKIKIDTIENLVKAADTKAKEAVNTAARDKAKTALLKKIKELKDKADAIKADTELSTPEKISELKKLMVISDVLELKILDFETTYDEATEAAKELIGTRAETKPFAVTPDTSLYAAKDHIMDIAYKL